MVNYECFKTLIKLNNLLISTKTLSEIKNKIK